MSKKPDFDNVVFEDRNKEYGAFYLRKFYKNSVLIGFIISAFVFSAAISAPLAYSKFFGKDQEEEETESVVVDIIDVAEPIIPEEIIKPPEPEKIEEASTVKNVELEIKPDNQVKDNTPPPTEDALKGKQSGTIDNEGSSTVNVPQTPKAETLPAPAIESWAPEMPEFPGGPSELLKFYGKHLEYTPRAEEEGIEGTVRVQFVVHTDGSITDVKIVKPLGYGLDEEVLRVFKKMPKWKPGRKGGKDVAVRMVTPIVFTLEE